MSATTGTTTPDATIGISRVSIASPATGQRVESIWMNKPPVLVSTKGGRGAAAPPGETSAGHAVDLPTLVPAQARGVAP